MHWSFLLLQSDRLSILAAGLCQERPPLASGVLLWRLRKVGLILGGIYNSPQWRRPPLPADHPDADFFKKRSFTICKTRFSEAGLPCDLHEGERLVR